MRGPPRAFQADFAPRKLCGELVAVLGWNGGGGQMRRIASVKKPFPGRRAGILNAGVVNARAPCLSRAAFCVFFRVLGRFLRFRNPVKYVHRSQLNRSRPHFLIHHQCVTQNFRRVTFGKGACAKLYQIRTARRREISGGGGHLPNSYMIAPRDASRGTRSLCRHADRSRTQRGRARIRVPDRRDPGRFDRRNPGAARALRRAAHRGRLGGSGRHRGAGGRCGLRHLRLRSFCATRPAAPSFRLRRTSGRARTPASSTPLGSPPAARP